jgi:hypothetical protein
MGEKFLEERTKDRAGKIKWKQKRQKEGTKDRGGKMETEKVERRNKR